METLNIQIRPDLPPAFMSSRAAFKDPEKAAACSAVCVCVRVWVHVCARIRTCTYAHAVHVRDCARTCTLLESCLSLSLSSCTLLESRLSHTHAHALCTHMHSPGVSSLSLSLALSLSCTLLESRLSLSLMLCPSLTSPSRRICRIDISMSLNVCACWHVCE
jgi:hypothetical protein